MNIWELLNTNDFLTEAAKREVFYKKSCSYKFRNILRKTPVLELLFDKVAKTGVFL